MARIVTKWCPASRRSLGRRFDYLWATFGLASLGDGFGYGAVPLLALFVDPQPVARRRRGSGGHAPLARAGAAGRRSRRPLRAGTAHGRHQHGARPGPGDAGGTRRARHHRPPAAPAPRVRERRGASDLLLRFASDRAGADRASVAHTGRTAILGGTEAATEHLGGPILGTIGFAVANALPFAADAVAVGVSGLSLLGFRTERPKARAAPRLDPGRRQATRWKTAPCACSWRCSRRWPDCRVSWCGVLVLVATVNVGDCIRAPYGAFLAAGAVGNVPGALLADRIVDADRQRPDAHRLRPRVRARLSGHGLRTRVGGRRGCVRMSSVSQSLPAASSRTRFANASPLPS